VLLRNLVVIASSTGGPQTLRAVFGRLPVLDASIVVVQHMPQFVEDSMCQGLDRITDMHVSLAQTGDRLSAGRVFLAPADRHLVFEGCGVLRVVDGPKVNYVRPSADVTMKSVTHQMCGRPIGVVLTGIGRDDADGIVHLKQLGGTTIAQDESTCVIHRMPEAAVATKYVDYILTPTQIHDALARLVPTPRGLCRANTG
jgi:two-component system, chemotaxis family, protein-glutamate methylesterase/glutaminase